MLTASYFAIALPPVINPTAQSRLRPPARAHDRSPMFALTSGLWRSVHGTVSCTPSCDNCAPWRVPADPRAYLPPSPYSPVLTASGHVERVCH
ncbi:hypothetical protein FRC12_021142 [Ceratobasidium sp. 428]|nr:hypothetical protein FRC12_021142 [Ceratobasidium sp. 428]